MHRALKLSIVSDVHFAGPAERTRADYLLGGIRNPLLVLVHRAYRHYLWLRDPFDQNYLLEEFLRRASGSDFVVANGDYSCDSGFIGVSDDAACQSARMCLQKLRERFGRNFQATLGDHELGKRSLGGGLGGLRLASFRRAQSELGLEAFWQVNFGQYVLLGLASPLIAYPLYESETLPQEREQWSLLRETHLEEVRRAFAGLRAGQRVLLFCHDPSALSYLWAEPEVRSKIAQLEQTIIGHLHSPLLLWKSRLLAGLPPVRFLGHTARRLSLALREAGCWKEFKVRLCPSLTGIQLLKDGGFYAVDLDPQAARPARFRFHSLPWRNQ